MPTLVQIDSCLGKGSTGRITEAIGDIMKRQGWNCYVVHGARYAGKSHQQSLQVVSKFQEYLHAFGSLLFDKHGLFSSKETKELISKLREIKPDIIHLHCVHGYYINYKLLFEYLKEIQIPIVWTFHDCWAFTGHCAHFAFAGCDKWMDRCYDCPLLKDYPKSFLLDSSKSNWLQKKKSFTSVSDMHVVAVSEWIANLAKQSFFNKYPIKVIYNGVDLSIFKPTNNDVRQRLNIADRDAVVLGVATAWGPEKGLNEFIKLSQERYIKVILVGVAEDIQKTLPKEIIAVRRTENQEELAEFYSAADIFINPTYNDSFPTVNIESLACGTPVITYKTGGSPEAVDETTGLIVEQGDYQTLLKSIRLFKDQSFKETHTIDCRNRAIKYFNKNERFEEYRVLYNKLITD